MDHYNPCNYSESEGRVAIGENLEQFKGRPVVDWKPDESKVDFGANAIRIRVEYDEADEGITAPQRLSELLEENGSDKIESLVIGTWEPQDTGEDSSEVVEALVAARAGLPNLRNLFIGDIMMEECEISWIRQSDMSPLLSAFPNLEHLTVRGGENLSFGMLSHDRLKELCVQTGGLPPSVIHEIATAKLPMLEHLELWLGEPNYGGDATVEDLAPLLKGGLFPKLKYLGLKDSVIQDDIAGVVALAPILNQLEILDLSMGTLSDTGAQALLNSPGIRNLRTLDLHHHFLSKEMIERMKGLKININLEELQEPHEWGGEQHRFIAVSE
jgi:hypothetical protein